MTPWFGVRRPNAPAALFAAQRGERVSLGGLWDGVPRPTRPSAGFPVSLGRSPAPENKGSGHDSGRSVSRHSGRVLHSVWDDSVAARERVFLSARCLPTATLAEPVPASPAGGFDRPRQRDPAGPGEERVEARG